MTGREKLTMAQALNRALRDAMDSDESVVVFGEDVGELGGVFRITDGLTAEFGEDRCFDTPLAESGITGVAVGMAMNGLRPVVEMQFDAFAYPTFEQLVSHVAKMRNRTRGRVCLPMVVRIPYGGGIGGVEHHSDSSESYYAHTPGLQVVVPATVGDAYGLLRAAIAAPDPVIFLEPKRLYWSKEEVDLAEVGAQEGRSLAVVDLRSIVPFDDETVERAVRSTGRAVVVAEASGFASIASEIVARVTERCFHSLAAPIRRVTGLDIPYPPPKYEGYHLPTVDRILDAVDTLQWENG
jgi:2-oxoisovalerate dehydrogenase E1 component beta subunit